MEKKKLLVLSAVFLALLLFVVLFERHQPTSEEAARAKKHLVSFQADEVTALAVERPDLPKLELKRQKERWVLVSAPGGPADRQAVDTLLADLGRLEAIGEPQTEFDPKEFGLDKPKATVTLTRREGPPLKITFGEPVPGTDATAAAEGGKMAAVRYAPLATLVKPVDEFRSKALVDVPSNEITGLIVAKGPFRAALERQAGSDGLPGPWRLVEPVKDLAAQSFVDQLLADLTAARVSEFPALPDADRPRVGLEPPVATITVIKGKETATTIAIGAAKADAAGKIFAMRDGMPVVTDDRLFEDLSKEFSAFREQRLLPVDSWAVARVSFAAGAVRTGAERVEGEWRSAGRTIPAAAAEDLLERITRVVVKAFVPKKEYAAHGIADRKGKKPAPLATVTIQREAGSPVEEIALYPASPLAGTPVAAAEVTGRSDALLVEAELVEELKALAMKLRAAETKPAKEAATPAAAPAPASPAPPAPAATSPAPAATR